MRSEPPGPAVTADPLDLGPRAGAILARYHARIRAGLEDGLRQLPPEIQAMARYHCGLESGARLGKALRPTLTWLLAEGMGAEASATAALATAVEVVHDFSLVHDDIVDEDTERRGRPALWVRQGVPSALNTGDALLTLAFRLVAVAPLPPGPALRAAAGLSAATLEMVDGQQADISAAGAPPEDLATYLAVVERKTGALMGTACELGAIAADATPAAAAACAEFGRALGVAFQLRDDVLGVFGDAVTVGKPVGNDLLRRKLGLPLLLALTGEGAGAAEARSWITGPGLRPEALAGAVARLRADGVAGRCVALTTYWTERALGAVTRLPIDASVRAELDVLCRWLGERAA